MLLAPASAWKGALFDLTLASRAAHVDSCHLLGGKRASGEMPAGDCAFPGPAVTLFPGHAHSQGWPRSPPGAMCVQPDLGGEVVVISVGLLSVHLMPPNAGDCRSDPPPVPERPEKGFRKIR